MTKLRWLAIRTQVERDAADEGCYVVSFEPIPLSDVLPSVPPPPTRPDSTRVRIRVAGGTPEVCEFIPPRRLPLGIEPADFEAKAIEVVAAELAKG